MAFGKTAGCLILAGAMGAAGAMAAPAAQFTARHEHLRKGCSGIMKVDENGVSFAGPKKHAWSWKYQDIQELELGPRSIYILTYKDNRWKLGADRSYKFTGNFPAPELYEFLKDRMDQRFVAAWGKPPGPASWSLPVKHLRRIRGSEGSLAFGPEAIVYETAARGESRTWRYADIDNISSSGPFQLTITTLERARSHYGDRKGFNFELKQPITEARYNQLWLEIEKKNGRIQ